jgi:hypothetical protein
VLAPSLFCPFIAAATPPVIATMPMMLVRLGRQAGTGNENRRNKGDDKTRMKGWHGRSPDGSIRGGVPAKGINFAATEAA